MRQVRHDQGISPGSSASSRREVAGLRRLRQGVSQEIDADRAQENSHRRKALLVRHVRQVLYPALDSRHTQAISHGSETVSVQLLHEIVRVQRIAERSQ